MSILSFPGKTSSSGVPLRAGASSVAALAAGGAPMRPHFTVPVRIFHEAYGCAAPAEPSPLDDQTRYARLQLNTEETGELFWALAAGDLIKALDALCDIEYVTCGTLVACGADRCGHQLPNQLSDSDGPPRLPPADLGLQLGATLLEGTAALAMALAANQWAAIANVAATLHVTLGKVWAAFRVPQPVREALLDEVQRSNMTKFDAEGRPVVNEAGRVVKGPNYEPPRLVEVLMRFYGADYQPPALRGEVTTPLSGGVR